MNLQDILNQANGKNLSIEEFLKEQGISLENVNIDISYNSIFDKLINHCENLFDYRRKDHNFRHCLSTIVFLSIIAVFCLAKDVKSIYNFIRCNYNKFRNNIELPKKKNGEPISLTSPSYSTILRCLRDIEPDQLELCIKNWVDTIQIYKSCENKNKIEMNSNIDITKIAKTASKQASNVKIYVDNNETIEQSPDYDLTSQNIQDTNFFSEKKLQMNLMKIMNIV